MTEQYQTPTHAELLEWVQCTQGYADPEYGLKIDEWLSHGGPIADMELLDLEKVQHLETQIEALRKENAELREQREHFHQKMLEMGEQVQGMRKVEECDCHHGVSYKVDGTTEECCCCGGTGWVVKRD